MSKYTTGHYKITLFSDRGAKIDQYGLGDVGMIRAIDHGREKVANGECHSFCIDRNAFNSLDEKSRWSR